MSFLLEFSIKVILQPIISTKSTDLGEMIHEGKNGYIVPLDDCAALVNAMEKLIIMSLEQRREMGDFSYELFEESFIDRKVAHDFQKFYQDVIQQSGAVRNNHAFYRRMR